jgi:MFS family permease
MDKFGRKKVFIFSMIITAFVHLQFLMFKGPYHKD